MDTAEIFVLVGGTFLIAFTLWFFFGKRDEEAAVTTADGKPVYECPMHPWITSPDPAANCSICGMKLVRRGDAAAKADAGAKHEAMQHGHGAPSHH